MSTVGVWECYKNFEPLQLFQSVGDLSILFGESALHPVELGAVDGDRIRRRRILQDLESTDQRIRWRTDHLGGSAEKMMRLKIQPQLSLAATFH